MSTPSHFLGSYVVLTITKPLWKKKSITPKTANWIVFYGMVLSILIDLDVLWSTQGIVNHHLEFTHWPLTWIAVFIIFTTIGYLKKSDLITSIARLTLIAGLFHIFMDSFAVTFGVPYLAPFSFKLFSITTPHAPFTNNIQRILHIIQTPSIIYREIILITMGFIYLIHQNTRLITQRVLSK